MPFLVGLTIIILLPFSVVEIESNLQQANQWIVFFSVETEIELPALKALTWVPHSR